MISPIRPIVAPRAAAPVKAAPAVATPKTAFPITNGVEFAGAAAGGAVGFTLGFLSAVGILNLVKNFVRSGNAAGITMTLVFGGCLAAGATWGVNLGAKTVKFFEGK